MMSDTVRVTIDGWEHEIPEAWLVGISPLGVQDAIRYWHDQECMAQSAYREQHGKYKGVENT